MIAKTMTIALAAAAGLVQAAPSIELVSRQNSRKYNGVNLKVLGSNFKIACGADIDAHGDLFAKSAETAKDCAALCLVYGSGCHAVTWNPYNQRCYGKGEPFTTLTSAQGITLTLV